MKHGFCAYGKTKFAPSYNIWNAMKQRCFDKNYPPYERYGGRGITVCKRWLVFQNFLDDMGHKPEGLSIDRKNNDGNYCKSNCRWATPKEQADNRRKRRWRKRPSDFVST